MSIGKGSVSSMYKKQKINPRSSTESELVGADETMTGVVCTQYFIEAQVQDIE
jgi:hypothetical protein